MESIYDKLGDMLHSYLETGELPPRRERPPRKQNRENGENADDSLPGSELRTVPPKLTADFARLGLLPDKNEAGLPAAPEFRRVRAAYARALKRIHPDTAEPPEAEPLRKTGGAETAEKLQALTAAFSRIKAWYEKRT
ncbi:hypothetical protein [Treponema brennaborense]|uniref:Uncharacterized protein n=1 Tax=Treponema brennaborense (strain DSM 12168 / CIP 105900 / DD5/3) TaxID=906968 RepID=F4LL12_TREBD|nr:hypothetical protein [Treponema brennaborense]AEE16609.1 hypothetical protein Trebr_1181 [Treponema brennaborense DSM 12168]